MANFFVRTTEDSDKNSQKKFYGKKIQKESIILNNFMLKLANLDTEEKEQDTKISTKASFGQVNKDQNSVDTT